MSLRHAPLAHMLVALLAAMPASLAAEPWEKIDELPGGIAVELDQDSVFEALDGARLVLRGTFRRPNGGWMMESNVAVDCELEQAKLRGIRLMDGDTVLTERTDHLAEFAPINAGSAEAIYYKALCGKEASIAAVVPEALPEDEGADGPPVEEPVVVEASGEEEPGVETIEAEDVLGEDPPE